MKSYGVLGGGTTWFELDLSKYLRVFGFEGLTFFLNQTKKRRRKNWILFYDYDYEWFMKLVSNHV